MIFISLKKSSIILKTSYVSFRKYNQVMQEKPSIKSKIYLKPLTKA